LYWERLLPQFPPLHWPPEKEALLLTVTVSRLDNGPLYNELNDGQRKLAF
jgi:hypothetical protein